VVANEVNNCIEFILPEDRVFDVHTLATCRRKEK
jgi:hypothetical protein